MKSSVVTSVLPAVCELRSLFRVSFLAAAGTVLTATGTFAAVPPVPDYSRPAQAYPVAPPAVGLPTGPAELAKTNPGIYADYNGEMFGEGAYYIVGPQQPLAPKPLPSTAGAPALCPKLRMVALVRTGETGADAFEVARRLNAEILSVPIAFRDLPKPPQGLRVTELSMKRLRDALAGPVDVILVSKLLCALPEAAQDLIAAKVTAGTGLVAVGPLPAKGALLPLLPVVNPAQPVDDKYHDYRNTQGTGWLTGGVAFALWPGMDVSRLRPWVDFDPRHANLIAYKPKPDAQTAATLDNQPMMITGQAGKGRVVLMGYAGNRWDGGYIPIYGPQNDLSLLRRARFYYEQMFSLVMKATVHAAAGDSLVEVLWPENETLTLAENAGSVLLRARNRGTEAQSLEATCVLRDGPTWQELGRRVVSVKIAAGGETTWKAEFDTIPVVSVQEGTAETLLEVVLRNGKEQVVDWGTILLRPAVLPQLECLVKKETVFPGEAAEVALSATTALGWRVLDLWGREIAGGTLPAGKHTVSFKPDNLSGLATLIVDAQDAKGRLTARAVREIYTPIYSQEHDFYNLLWPRGSQPFQFRDFAGSVLRRQGGIGTTLNGAYFTRPYSAELQLRGLQRCAMTNVGPRFPFSEFAKFPEEAEKNLKQARELYTDWIGRYGPLTLHMQDERHSPPITKSEFSPALLKAFREWLKQEYGSVEALNRSWLSDWKEFDQVLPTLVVKEVIAQPKSYGRWLDLIRFGEQEVGMTYDLELIKILEQETRGHIAVGFEGIFSLYGGHLNPYGCLNVPRFFDSGAKMNNMAYGIGTPMWELCASLNPEADSGSWLGYESERNVYRTEPWRGVLSGATFMGWFIDSLWFTAEGAVAERLSWVEQYTRALRQGVGRTLIEANREFDQVAILANMRSSQMSWMIGKQMDPDGDGRGSHWMIRPMEDSGNAFLALCRDAGVSPAYITEGQVLGKRLDQFKVLCLVYDTSISTKVAEAIREWVRQGGTLIADCGAGAADEHGRFLEKGQLDDVFGIRREGAFATVAEAGDFTVGLMEPAECLIDAGCQKGNWYMVEYFEENLKATTAKTMGKYVFRKGADQCFWNDFGQGHALYFGFLLNRYRSSENEFTSVYPLFKASLKQAGVKPPVEMVSTEGLPLRGYTITQFRDGQRQYTGIMRREPESPATVVADFGRPGHAYEVLTNRYLGSGTTFKVDLASGEATKAGMPTLAGQAVQSQQDAVSGMGLVAFLPAKIEKVAVSAENSAPGQPLALQAGVECSGGNPGRTVLYLDVRDPDGNQAEPYCRNVVAPDGVWKGSIPLARNDARGTWTITVREPISGLSATTKVKVK